MSSRPETSRRAFLTGRAALEAIRGIVERNDPPPKSPLETARESCSPSFLMEFSRPAMAVEFQIYLNAGLPPHGPEVALCALDLVDALEAQLSVYCESSEVSQINRRASLGPMTIEPRLFALLQQSLTLYETTGGAFDITSGPLSKVWGFFRRQGRFPQEADVRETLDRVGSRWLTLDAQAGTVQFSKPCIEINFHAIGKGYTLDRCAELLREGRVDDYLIHGGQSSILASGSRAGASEERRGWWIALRHPLRPEQQLGEIRLLNRALGTSGSGVQFFFHQGRRFGHILDPRTGWPAEGVLSATVLAPTAAEADALATAFYIWTPQQTAEFCRLRPDLGAILVCPGERAGSLSLYTYGIDDSDWRIWATRDQ